MLSSEIIFEEIEFQPTQIQYQVAKVSFVFNEKSSSEAADFNTWRGCDNSDVPTVNDV